MDTIRFRRARSVIAAFGLILMILGGVIFLAAGGLYAYGEYERAQFAQELASLRAEAEAEAPATDGSETIPPPEQSGTSETPLDVPSISPSPTPTLVGAPAPRPVRVVIPRIGVDTVVQEAKLENGEWQVPKFAVGHLQGTGNPGENGNVVLSGHLESISSGNVFARLNEMKLGDGLTIFTKAGEFEYQVNEIKVVKNDDMSVVQPTPDQTVTLITCTGDFDILRRDYSHRLIVIAKPVPQDAAPQD